MRLGDLRQGIGELTKIGQLTKLGEWINLESKEVWGVDENGRVDRIGEFKKLEELRGSES